MRRGRLVASELSGVQVFRYMNVSFVPVIATADSTMIHLTATELSLAQATGNTTAQAITQAFLTGIRERDDRVKAFLAVDEATALDQAQAVDAKRKRGEPLGKLAGIPVAIKDVLCTK